TDKIACYLNDNKTTKAGKCLRLAEVSFYNNLEDVNKIYGKPINSGVNNDNTKWYSYLINKEDKKTSPLLTITTKENKIIKINLSGYKSNDNASFSSIRLGDYLSFVKQKLGEPYYKKEVKAAGDETWVYMPVPIEIEFK